MKESQEAWYFSPLLIICYFLVPRDFLLATPSPLGSSLSLPQLYILGGAAAAADRNNQEAGQWPSKVRTNSYSNNKTRKSLHYYNRRS